MAKVDRARPGVPAPLPAGRCGCSPGPRTDLAVAGVAQHVDVGRHQQLGEAICTISRSRSEPAASRYLRSSSAAPIVLVTSTASSPSCSWSNLKIDAVVVASGGPSGRVIPRTPLWRTQLEWQNLFTGSWLDTGRYLKCGRLQEEELATVGAAQRRRFGRASGRAAAAAARLGQRHP